MFTTIKTWGVYLLVVLVGWLVVLMLVMILTDAAPGAIALFPPTGFIQDLPDGAGVVDGGRLWVGIRSDRPGLGLDLYRAGALLVLPAGLPGCLPLAERP